MSAAALRRRLVPERSAWLILGSTLALCALVALAARWGTDWPAQEFRAGLARTSGLLLFNDEWYAGHALAGYSLLYPPVAFVLGASGVGVASSVLAAWAVSRLLPIAEPTRRRLFAMSTAVVLAGSLLIGQVPFLLGTALGLCALLAVVRERPWLAAALAVACALSSPLSGAFLLLVGAALTAAFPWRRMAPIGAALVGPAVALPLGGAEGPMPCPWSSPAVVLLFAAFLAGFARFETTEHARVISRFALLYAISAVGAFVVPNPIGGNIVRLGRLIALPMACYYLTGDRRRRLLTMLSAVLPAAAWIGLAVLPNISFGATDPSRNTTYYGGLLTFLHTENPMQGRLEIPFTHDHWEVSQVAPQFPLARGWERQTDLQYNKMLYTKLTAASYHRWLRDTAVALVALPDVELDTGGIPEGRLLRHPPSYLRLVWQNAHWKVWRVVDAQPLASGPAIIRRLGPSSFEAQFTAPGTVIVRIRASSLWEVTQGRGCVSATKSGWITVTSPRAGAVDVSARLNMRMLGAAPACAG